MFLVGAPISAPVNQGEPGVPGEGGMIEIIRGMVQGSPERLERFEQAIAGASNRYQAAFSHLAGIKGPDAVGRVIRQGVLDARSAMNGVDEEAILRGDGDACRALEQDSAGWKLTPGLEALGHLLATFPDRLGQVVLTTNFDPLIEVAVARAGGSCHSTALHLDGSLETVQAEGCHVVHLHGSWWRTDTLHWPAQLLQPRPQLEGSLRRLVEAKCVVVLAFGGWDDVFATALAQVLADAGAAPDVCWTFFGDDALHLEHDNQALLDRLANGLGRGRVQLYRGVDVHRFLPELFVSCRRVLGAASRPRKLAALPPPTLRPSPFVVGPPITADADLFGRLQEKQQLRECLTRCQSVQILGERRMGKTSLLRWVERHAAHMTGWPVARVTAAGWEGRSPLHLVRAVAIRVGRDDLPGLPAEEELRSQVTAADGRAEALLLRLAPLVILVDEAEALAEPGRGFTDDFFAECRALGQNGELVWISASARNLVAMFGELGLTSAFLNDAAMVKVGLLEECEARRLLDRGPVTRTAGALLQAAGRFAFGLQWLGDAVWRGQEAERAVECFACDMEQVFRRWWGLRTRAEQGLLKRCGDPTSRAELAKAERVDAIKLEGRGLLEERDGKLVVPGSAWREWVRDAG